MFFDMLNYVSGVLCGNLMSAKFVFKEHFKIVHANIH